MAHEGAIETVEAAHPNSFMTTESLPRLYFDILQLVAEIAASFIGFVGVVYALGQATRGQLSSVERIGLFHLLYGALAGLFCSLLLMLALATGYDESSVWRFACVVLPGFSLLGGVSEWRSSRDGTILHPVVARLVGVPPVVMLIPSVLAAIGVFEHWAPVVSLAWLMWFLGIAVLYFVSLLGRHDVQGNEGSL